MTLEDLQIKFSTINPYNLISQVFKDSKIARFVLNLNRENQLFAQGIGVDGEIIGTYTIFTQQLTDGIQGRGFPKNAGRPYNFYSTGEMYNSFSIRVENDGFVINADTSDLENSGIINSKKEIIGLTNESKIELVKEILPILASKIRAEITK
jgi:hypothetical protein